MKTKLITIGNIVFDYIFISILINISLLTVIPFISILVGLVAYFNTNTNERSLLIIFKTIKTNIKMIFKLTLLFTIVLGAIVLNLYVIDQDTNIFVNLIKGLSYVGLFILLNIVINGPIILLKMNVTLKQLLANSVLLIFGDIKNYLLIVITVGLFVYGITYSYLVLVLGVYFVISLISKLTYINFKKIRETNK